LWQVLERDCTPEEFAKKRAKIEGKRKSAFGKVSYMIAICMKRRALPHKEMPEWEEMCAVACAVQNMWLSMTAHGAAGTCPFRCAAFAALSTLPSCSLISPEGGTEALQVYRILLCGARCVSHVSAYLFISHGNAFNKC